MTDIEDSDRYNPRESENDEARIPSRIMQTITHNQPHPFTALNQSKSLENNHAPLLSDKPKCTPIAKKDLSREEIEEPESRVRKIRSPSSNGEQNELRSNKSQHSVSGKIVVSSSNVGDEVRKKPIRRMNSKMRLRASKLQNVRNVPTARRVVASFIESWGFSLTMALVTLYALFGDDIRILSVQKDQDDVFFILTIICMSLFTLEIILQSIANPDYVFNFYFCLDVLSTATMILDIGWITDSWYGDEGNIDNAATIKALGRASRAARKAARVIRVVRLVRLVKLYKHARQQYEKEQQRKILQEILKQNRLTSEENQKQQTLNSGSHQQIQQQLPIQRNPTIPSPPISGRIQVQQNVDKQQDDQQKLISDEKKPYMCQTPQQDQFYSINVINPSQQSVQSNQFQPDKILNSSSDGGKSAPQLQIGVKETNVGTVLSDLVMRRVITIILAILISIPILSLDTYQEVISSYDSGIFRISQFRDHPDIVKLLVIQYIQFHTSEIYPILAIYVLKYNASITPTLNNPNDFAIYNHTQPEYSNYFNPTSLTIDEFRFSDKQYYADTDNNGNLVTCSVADLVDYNKTNALLSIFQTIFVCLVLALSAVLFNKNVTELVIEPIEGMMQKIEMIASNPLEAVNIEEQEDLVMEQLEKQQDHRKIREKQIEKRMETYILQRLIMKVGALLAVGFGEAGSEIIAENIKKGGSVDPMMPGKKIMAIFGFCDIRNFTDATEVLQQDVMVFVNEIAEIVHSTVDAYGGSANKNIGDAFLLVWKYLPMEYHPDPTNPSKLLIKNELKIKQKGDMAVLSFLKIITTINISKKLEKYKYHQGLNARMKDYSVKMGFGLHMGWGIEGAIGSSFKIDASYLSPNVNMASRLEAATKQFGTLILISGILKKHLTEKCQQQLRLIDIVTVKGSIEPVELHTVDMSMKNLHYQINEYHDKFDTSLMTQKQQKQFRVLNRFKRDQLQKEVAKDKAHVADQFQTDEELHAARQPYTEQFYTHWKEGFNYYIKGQWDKAQSVFQQTLTMIPDHKDGPSNTLLEVIRSSGGKAPNDWKGYRELTEK